MADSSHMWVLNYLENLKNGIDNYIYHQTSLPFRKLCLEDDNKLPVDLRVILTDILPHHTLFGMQKKLSLLAFPHLKALML
ncbi:hypothetical protein DAPPUDRAFT_332440 [Daphnia pulex]|uniref:Suv3 N-terminal domain-containing protein n=1 Tax=Daphnia pulex TaxID=6669 RepID=E9HPZ3_DAPPU|nr:hypothetical protein DAPPUDRAFT_332440 [Daphnia pulex]|eukprot:EFX66187.1 hypothetical protein DAPPUDRAFT_332440 [Daphnia pulex]